MRKIKLLFLIHDLGQGGAEKVLVNLVNNLDSQVFDISLISLFEGGVNEQFLKENIRYRTIFPYEFPANSKIMKLFSPAFLHSWLIKEKYDIEVSYLEGPCARIISGCPNREDTKLINWVHVEQHTREYLSGSFRSFQEAKKCYETFDKTVCVSQFVKQDFTQILDYNKPCCVLYNTVESEKIKMLAHERTDRIDSNSKLKLISVGTLKQSKGYDRLFRIINRLVCEGRQIQLYVLGVGPKEKELQEYVIAQNLSDSIILLGYDTNPYKYVSKCDLFVCASFAEGFSTAATESLILGVPVCTVDVSGMKEMLGDKNQFGVVTENTEEALYHGLADLIDNPEKLSYYTEQARHRGALFSTENTVGEVQKMLLDQLSL